MSRHVIVVRLDSMGDVLVCGPAVRAVAARASEVTLLVGPRGAEAARLLPGVNHVVVWDCPWISADAPRVHSADLERVIDGIRGTGATDALVLTSFHQSALPTALVLRLAGMTWIAAISVDYPGSLLDLRLPEPDDAPEPVRMLAVAEAAGFPRPPSDDGRLAVTVTAVTLPADLPCEYVVLHPGAAASSRTCSPAVWAGFLDALRQAGRVVALTGTARERATAEAIVHARIADTGVRNLTGALTLAELAAVMQMAACVVSGNTGPAHLAAAVGTPVVSLFSPVVPARRWAPYGEAVVVLGDQNAACAGTRATMCPIPGHPCLDGVDPMTVVDAVLALSGQSLLTAGAH
ncbi:MAG TPA: glycosyltransferase family 9 protein [Jatrophihabitantaceae bacterium]|jgi:ADP-heptose:LPS heptosyltransferase|nr:glycosyltransferase family 9 protein [Jatrophihabitantaceae bacterium]